ncbi:MAG: glycoside hydrolase family 38 N-terminal domain-containing protein [Saccharofermentanales bacterium]
MKKMHLICNAHIDPVWQWEWEEGVGAAISTFRVAAQLCEENDDFVFNHNEVILYKWIEEYEPVLFARIQKLVEQGKWHIMGGWYVQPDCNMPGGESIIRQIINGLDYFKEKFGSRPTIAINLDPFGHTKGLVQILEKSGFKGYIICRPDLEFSRFVWQGFNGSQIKVLRAPSYNSPLGKVDEKISYFMNVLEKDREIGVTLWGVGNHGGGPSKKDLEIIGNIKEKKIYDAQIIHSTPEEFFEDIKNETDTLPVIRKSLQHTMVGCYTSQIRIKHKHKKLENELIRTEKMLSHASLPGGKEFLADNLKSAWDELKSAWEDLMFAQFHDILPGSSVQPVEEAGIRIMEHGIEIASRIKGRAFFKLSAGQVRAKDKELPILVYNSLPYRIKGIVACEFMLADQNYNFEFSNPIVYQGDKRLKCQPEKELSNLPLDWRKRVVFEAELEPMQMNRFDVRIEVLPEKPLTSLHEKDGYFTVETPFYTAKLNTATGYIDSYSIGGIEILKEASCRILAIKDNVDPWGMTVQSYKDVIGSFTLADPKKAAHIAGNEQSGIKAVRVIEDGDIRTLIEAIFVYENSQAVIRYSFPKNSSEIGINIRVLFNEKDTMLKLSIPATLQNPEYFGKTMFGTDDLLTNGDEVVAQDYVVLTDKINALSVINNGTYGSSCQDGEIRMSLMRSAAYCAHPINDRQILAQDRFNERIDQGERILDFYINASDFSSRMHDIESESSYIQEPPMAVCFFPPEEDEKPLTLCSVDNKAIKLSAFKQAMDKNGFIIRLFNSDLKIQSAVISLPSSKLTFEATLESFEIKTFRLLNGIVKECDLNEEM